MRRIGHIGCLLLACAMAVSAGCARHVARSALPWQDARQAVVVTTADWDADHGTLQRFERRLRRWKSVGEPRAVEIGRSGAAWGIGLHPAPANGPIKREGDGRSPAGVFGIGDAFGYADTATTALPYKAMQASSYCIDVSGSPLYNRIVDTRVVGEDAVAGSTEPMRRDLHAAGDQRYRLGFVIEHNSRSTPMAGSCIFAHVWKSPESTTSGCTAMAPTTMETVLSWLRPDARPVFVLLPLYEYRRLQSTWDLPPVGVGP
jgi:L,D-peptidoglycan transpeptidase YkuD (ErfK/YbiS/YcfS/YnhG family)